MSKKLHTEERFEDELERSLLEAGGYSKGNPNAYDKQRALFPDDVIHFIQNTQPKLWQRVLTGQKDEEKARERIIHDLDKALAREEGSLAVLRKGFKCYGKTIKMAYFKPNQSLNETAHTHYNSNVVTVTRQVHTEDNEIPDVVLSINGIPVVTMELKNEMSATNWTVEDAKHQYMYERNQHGKLYKFKTRTLVHFAVDTQEVYMTTRLAGEDTFFLPFNRGCNDGAGNPSVEGNVKTAYLWEEVLTKDSLMDIVQRFIHLEKTEKKVKTSNGFELKQSEIMIFPRFHQLDVVRKLVKHSREHGSGHNYLVQHSAGSGKSNSIAWLSHQLSSMHNADDEKVFNSVIVITDRVVLDKQLQDTITQFDHKDGVIETIDKNSKQLASAIAGDKQIIITTIQKFPFVLSSIEKQREKGSNIDLTTKDKRFAIIVDEAHSSQTGETASELRQILNQDGIESAILSEFLDDEDAENLTDVEKASQANALREASKRQKQPNLSYFAFTATPKWKTLALFDEKGENGEAPFHKYTMKQAIQEGFIMDVLSNYCTYKQYFKLLKISEDDKELSKNKAKKELMRFVNIHPSVITQKVEIIVEHFRTVTINKIGGRAKAMVVTDSREKAVRYKLAFDEYIKEKGYEGIKSLVAFSGKLALEEVPEKFYTEVAMNNGIQESKLKNYFDTDEYNVLLVADKYQTGFDQPLLHTMFVDKKLSGVQAVQTLSRLNRTIRGKTDTFVLDFVNTHEDIYEAFKDYYTVTKLGDIPDSDKLEDLANTLDGWKLYFETDIDEYADIWFKDRLHITGSEHKGLNSIIDRATDKYNALVDASEAEKKALQEENQRKFKSDLQSYLNLYLFVSQIMDYSDTSHEKRFVYLKALLAKLPKGSKDAKVDLSKDVVLHFHRLQKMSEGAIDLDKGESKELKGSTDVGTGKPKATENVSEMITEINEAFGTDFTVADQLFFEQIIEEALQDEQIVQAVKANSLDNFTDFLSSKLLDLFLKRMTGNEEITNTVLNNDALKDKITARLAKSIFKQVDR